MITAPSLPHNFGAEQAVLGSLLYDPAAIDHVGERLTAAHFHEPVHGRLFNEAAKALRAGRTAEPVVLMERFKRDPAFEGLGGLRYLADLVDKAPPTASVRDYARVVYDLAQRRELIRIGDAVATAAANDDIETADLLAQAEGDLFALAEDGERDAGPQPIASGFGRALATAAAAMSRDGGMAGLSTGLLDLDRKLGGLCRPDLIIVAGRPSMGKTALATNVAYTLARLFRGEADADGVIQAVQGGRVLFYSLEMSAEQLSLRILSDATGISSDRVRRGAIDQAEFGELQDARVRLDAMPLHVDDTGGLSIAKLCARARRHKRRHGLDLIVVDYLQLITASGGKQAQGRVQEVTEITAALKALAKELDVPVIALSQLSRKVEEREDKRPQLADLRESGSIEQDADVVMFVYRESYYRERAEPTAGSPEHLAWLGEMEQIRHLAEVIIGKQRHGPIGTVRLSFDADTTRFGNLAREAAPHWMDGR